MIEPTLEIKNKVAQSGLITLNLEDYYHTGERIAFDIKPWLFKEMILKEADFRSFIKEHNWVQYQNKNLAINCSTDAIIPVWAYMLLGLSVQNIANRYIFGNLQTLEETLYYDAIAKINATDFADKRVIVKGCSNKPVPVQAYLEITNKLAPVVKSLMYGEACSNVPLYKKK